jgi:hypothetical protein
VRSARGTVLRVGIICIPVHRYLVLEVLIGITLAFAADRLMLMQLT